MSRLQPAQPTQPPLMVVYETHIYEEAHIIMGRLHSEGIAAVVHHMPGATALGITIGKLGAIQVLVKAADYELALSLLYPDESPQLPDEHDDTLILPPQDHDD